MYLNDLASRKQRLLQIVRILKENHQFDLPLDSHLEWLELNEHYSQVQQQIQNTSAFNSYHTNPLYAKAVLITEAVRMLLEIAPRRMRRRKIKESTQPQVNPMSKLNEKAKPDFLDVDKDGNKKETFKKALADKKKAEHLDEKWDAEMKTAAKDVGKWEGYTIAELKARKKKLMDKAERSAAEQKEVRQINFAIRAKQENSWGKIKESTVDEGRQDPKTEKEMADAVANYKGPITVGKTKKGKGSQPYMMGSYHRGRTGAASGDLPVRVSSIPKVKLREDETLDKAETLLAAKDISDRLQNMAEDAAKMAVDRLMPLVDTMKSQFGQPAADGFNEVVKAELQTVLDTIIAAKDQTDNAILALQGGETPSAAPMDLTAPLPAAEPAGEAGAEPAGESPEGEIDFEKEFAATPAAGGPEEEPLGRAKKEPMAEAKSTCMECNTGVMEAHDGKMVCNECGYTMIAEKLTKKMSAGEIISDFVHSDDPKFKGKSKAERTKMALGAYYGMHPEKKRAEESQLAETHAHLKQLVSQFKQLQESFEAHKQEFKNSGRADPLNLGYGLEGDSIRLQLRAVRKQIEEAVEQKKHLQEQIQQVKIMEAQTQRKIQALQEQASSQAFGVVGVLHNGSKVRKFFENQHERDMWMQYNQQKLQEHRMIDPQVLDQVTQKLAKTLRK